MSILITGDKGFVGTETLRQLSSLDRYGYDIMDGNDIRDLEKLRRRVQEWGITRILHLAAIARFADADADPKLAHETNVLGTMNVARVASEFHIPLVYASTGSAIMPLNGHKPPYGEDIPARGNSVYGCTKAMGEYYVRQIQAPWIILRYAHLYGAEKRMHGAISGFLDRMERGLKPVLYGGQQSNDFTFVEDVARANVAALNASWDSWNNIYHIGTGEELSTAAVFQMVKELTGYGGEIDVKEQRTVDPDRFVFDCSKAKRMLGFEAKYSFREGLTKMLGQLGYGK
jgi:nucleoside-diphosphate-sugar epimerase